MYVMDNFESMVCVLSEKHEVTDKGKSRVVEEDTTMVLEEMPTYQRPKQIRIYSKRKKVIDEEKTLSTLITSKGSKVVSIESAMSSPPRNVPPPVTNLNSPLGSPAPLE